MRIIITLLTGVLALAAVGQTSSEAAGDRSESEILLARVNGDDITLEHLNIELNSFLNLAGDKTKMILPGTDEVLRRLVQNRLLEQEGYRIGSDKLPQVQNQIEDFLRRKGMVALLDSVSADAADMGASKLDSMMSVQQSMRRYSHILVSSEALADQLLDSLKSSVPFADLARRHSTDSNASRGGDLGWAAKGAYVPEFEAAAGELEIGELAGPVQTDFGWHLITLTELRLETFGQSPEMKKAMMQALEQENRMAAVREYVAGLRKKYDVRVDEALLASLDFGSEDPLVVEDLRNSVEVLAELPTGRLTVRGLDRRILFTYFHGLSGRDNADAIRDKMFREWVDEALLSHETTTLGFDRRPDLVFEAKQIERRLIREEVMNTVLNFPFDPSEEELREYYSSRRGEFTEPSQVKLKSVWLETEAAAIRFRQKLEGGAQLDWLAAREPGVMSGADPFPLGWTSVKDIELDPEILTEGRIIGPLRMDQGWALAKVIGVQSGAEKSFEDSREAVIAHMKRNRTRDTLTGAMDRLEAAAELEIQPGAADIVRERLAHYTQILENRNAENNPPTGRGSRGMP